MNTVMQQGNSNGILVYEGKEYAVGLTWFTGGIEVGSKALAKHRAKKLEGDFICQRVNVSQQHGIGWIKKGHRNNMLAAAPMAADKLVGQWHGVFEADNGWWYVQVFSDAVAPYGDMFFYNEQEAYEAFTANIGAHTWSHAYAPAKWSVKAASREVKLDALLSPNQGGIRLEAANLTAFFGSKAKMTTVMVSSALVLAGLIGGGIMVTTMLGQEAPPPRTASAKPAKPPPPKEVIIDEKISLPVPSSFMEKCGQAVAKIMRPVPGWPIQRATCEKSRAVVTWQQQMGSLQMARAEGQQIPSDASVTIEGKNMNASVGFEELPVFEVQEWLQRDDAVFELERRFNRLGALKVEIIIPKPPQVSNQPQGLDGPKPKSRKDVASTSVTTKTLPDGTQIREIVRKRPYIEMSLTTPTAPTDLGTAFDLLGMRVDKVSWDLRSRNWAYQAVLTLEYLDKK
jgi:hypothetical protein